MGSIINICLCFFLAVSVSVSQVSATEHAETGLDNVGGYETSGVPAQIAGFSAEFFAIYQPTTALDMVEQLPGFRLNDGDSMRGFASSAGNILINGRRLSTKQDSPSAILARIPASQVERIDLIQGQVRGLDLRGQTIVANVYLYSDVPSAIRWELSVMHNNVHVLRPRGSVSLSDRLGIIDYNIGIDVERDTSGYTGTEEVFDGNGTLVERRIDTSGEDGFRINGIYLNTSTWLGENFFQFNSKIGMNNSDTERRSIRFPQMQGQFSYKVNLLEEDRSGQIEVGADVERLLSSDLNGKAILLFSTKQQDPVHYQRNLDSSGAQTSIRVADSRTVTTEGIGRLEFDWSGIPNHAFQLNLEAAYNVLDGSLLQTLDTGVGTIIVDVPGSNSRVEEIRGDFLFKDTWTNGNFELDYGLGTEISTITQTGDEELERSFFFVKPQGMLTYSSGQGVQTRLRLAREVAQLNFNDFISATLFEDDNLILGNPNLGPDKTWLAELSHERRFSRLSVIKVTGFHHWISDVLDLFPLTPTFAVPGNIGEGRRWGIELESTAPLEQMGLVSARVSMKLRWQGSKVVDPVTGEVRPLSGEGGMGTYRSINNLNKNNKYFASIDFRQDFEQTNTAWGWIIARRDQRPLYKVNELDIYNEGYAIDGFVETTRWFGLKTRLSVLNMLDDTQKRDRSIFVAERGFSAIDSRILINRHIGRRITLSLSGNF